MARVNLSPIQIPRKILEDPELSKFFESLTFSVYQLFKRTGGGNDFIQNGSDASTENRALIDQNISDIEENNNAITINIANIATNTANITTNTTNIATNTDNIAINTGDIADLKQTFSWKLIPVGEEITIATNQQMIVADGIIIDGSLIANGELSLI